MILGISFYVKKCYWELIGIHKNNFIFTAHLFFKVEFYLSKLMRRHKSPV